MVRWLVFGGWAMKPDLLAPVFGTYAAYVDTNAIMPFLVNDGKLHSDWQVRLFDIVNKGPGIPDKPFGIAGWSTGAMLAWSLAGRLDPAASVFISATPSFCRRRESGFLYGQKSSVLKSMREQLSVDPGTVLMKFYEQCGITENSILFQHRLDTSTNRISNLRPPSPAGGAGFSNENTYSPFGGQGAIDRSIKDKPKELSNYYPCEQLVSGLHFLEQSTLLPVNQFSFPALFLHGKSDTIIPIDAGKYFCSEAGGTFVEHEGPHAFFLDDPAVLTKDIFDFAQKVL